MTGHRLEVTSTNLPTSLHATTSTHATTGQHAAGVSSSFVFLYNFFRRCGAYKSWNLTKDVRVEEFLH